MKRLMRKPFALLMLVLIGTFGIGTADARKKDKEVPLIPTVTTAEGFAALAADIRNGMSAGGRFEYVPASQERILLKQLDTIGSLLEKGARAELSDEDKVALFNAQEQANGILMKYDGNREICSIRNRTGSNRRETICTTYAEQRAAQIAAERMVRDMQNQDLPKGN